MGCARHPPATHPRVKGARGGRATKKSVALSPIFEASSVSSSCRKAGHSQRLPTTTCAPVCKVRGRDRPSALNASLHIIALRCDPKCVKKNGAIAACQEMAIGCKPAGHAKKALSKSSTARRWRRGQVEVGIGEVGVGAPKGARARMEGGPI